MLKLLKTLFITVLVFIIIYVVISIYLVKFDPNSIIGQNLRKSLIRYPSIVTWINLNQPGDYRYAYVNSKYAKISVNVYYSANMSPDADASTWIANTIKDTVNKKIDITMKELSQTEEKDTYSDQDLNLIRKNNTKTSNNPVLNIFYLTSYTEIPSYLGLTLHRDTIFLFKQTLINISDKPEIIKLLEQSTIMHEWGHLLGLPHSEEMGCVMSNYLETYENWPMNENMIPLTQCWDTTYALDKLKAGAK